MEDIGLAKKREEEMEVSGTSIPVAPDPEVPDRPVLRQFTTEYKLPMLEEADACSRPGELGALVRREGLYYSSLRRWRKQRMEGTYLCALRTMYRILASEGELRERRNQLRHLQYQKPELLATGPNQVWSWDITKLKAPLNL